jgi:hypothetical protein
MAGAKVPRLLHDTGHKIFKIQYVKRLEEFNRSLEFDQEFVYLFSEQQQMVAQKLVSYYLDVKFENVDKTLSVTISEDILKMFDPRI